MIPYSDTEKILLLGELERGEKVVIPSSLEHAEFMIMVAQTYIKEHKDKMLEILKA
jgi:hypothetical protein